MKKYVEKLAIAKTFNIKLFHKDSGQIVLLSSQQSLCLLLLSRGIIVKEIARIMGLSVRTVEHYFERIREILGCSSNMNLIITYLNQLNLYYLPDIIESRL